VVVLEMDPEPYDELVRLDEAQPALADRIDEWLNRIEADPDDAAVRRRLIRPGRVWAISVVNPAGRPDYLILWELDGDVPVVRYLGPDILGTSGDHE
jgi:hypothetical protein